LVLSDSWVEDDELLRALSRALRAAAEVDPAILDTAKAVYTWRTVDDELAVLAYDSLLDDRTLAGVRAVDAMRTLTFRSEDLSVEIGITDRAIVGQLVPPTPGEVELREASGATQTIPVDELGTFHLSPVPTGPISLRCRTSEGLTAVTEWFRC